MVAAGLFSFVVRRIEAMDTAMNRRKGPVDPENNDCPECLSAIPYKARRCAFCTAVLADPTAS